MAVSTNRCDRFPVGTTVGLYLANARHIGLHATGSPLEEHVVASDGSCGPFTTLEAGVQYCLYAQVGEAHRYLSISDEGFTDPGTLAARIQAKREAVGA